MEQKALLIKTAIIVAIFSGLWQSRLLMADILIAERNQTDRKSRKISVA
jgi:hypothetical protein